MAVWRSLPRAGLPPSQGEVITNAAGGGGGRKQGTDVSKQGIIFPCILNSENHLLNSISSYNKQVHNN